jgi:hypothetical protein
MVETKDKIMLVFARIVIEFKVESNKAIPPKNVFSPSSCVPLDGSQLF